ncbi:MAG TPA: hypothetical protein VFQ16_00230 [Burkholderiaceae bacterium]|nr:hypothetical protein [Burkholderiaceae bacterium]
MTPGAVRAAEPAPTAASGPAAGASAPAQSAPAAASAGWFGLGSNVSFGSWSDWFRLGNWSGALGLDVDDQRQKVDSPDSAPTRFGARFTGASLLLGNEGFYVIDPRLLVGRMGVRLRSDQASTDAAGATSRQRARMTDYNLDATVLSELPYVTTLFANRAHSTSTQALGGVTQVETANRGITFQLHENSILRDREWLPYFTAGARVLQERVQQQTRVSGQTFSRDDKRDLVAITAHNGGETSDLDLSYEHANFSDFVSPAGSYGDRTAGLRYSLDFGPTLNRRWDAHVKYYDRHGSTSLTSLSADTLLAIEHHANLSSGYAYQLLKQTTRDGSATVHSGSAQLQHTLWSNLTTGVMVSGVRQDVPGGKVASGSASLNFGYQHRLPGQGQLSMALGGSYGVTSTQVPAGFVPVLDSFYTAPPQFGAGAGFLLRDANIAVDSIVIVALKGGARVPTAPGVDYTVEVTGQSTRILPLPTSAVIMPGDQLDVSYVYLVDPSVKYRNSSRSFSLGADWQWGGVNYSHEENQQSPFAGQASTLLLDVRRDTFRLALRQGWNELNASGSATVMNYSDTRYGYRQTSIVVRADYTLWSYLALSASADDSRTTYVRPDRTTRTRSLSLSADWSGWDGWLARGYLSQRSSSDTQSVPERISEAGLKLNRRWTKLNLSASLALGQRERGPLRTQTANLHVAAIRRF